MYDCNNQSNEKQKQNQRNRSIKESDLAHPYNKGSARDFISKEMANDGYLVAREAGSSATKQAHVRGNIA